MPSEACQERPSPEPPLGRTVHDHLTPKTDGFFRWFGGVVELFILAATCRRPLELQESLCYNTHTQENPEFSARLAAIFLKGISSPPIDPGWVFLAPVLS